MFKFFGGSKDPGAAVMAAADVASSALPPPPAADSGSQRGSRSSLAAELSCRLDVDSQMSGHLFKRDTSGASNNWNLRFFVIKDGFLLWYPEQKEDRSGGRGTGGGGGGSIMTFDMHPKGVVPLDGVDIETVRAGPNAGMTSALRVTHPSFGTRSLLLCAGDDSERDRWVAALTASSYM